MATVPISALGGGSAIRQALGLGDAGWSLGNFRRPSTRPPFPQPVAQNTNRHLYDLREIRSWAKESGRPFHVETDIDAGPTIDPDLLVGSKVVGQLLNVSTPWVSQARKWPDFPSPVVTLAAGCCWNVETVKAWAAANGRKTYQTVEQPPAGT